jgi:hypothetical protein
LTYCGDPMAFYQWDREAQERVLAWWRVKHTPPPTKKSQRPKAREGDSIDPEARAFWGLGGG